MQDRGGPSDLTPHARKNLAMWENSADSYQAQHAEDMAGDKAMAWGLWRIAETELNILGDTAGKDILEFGCGAAQWSIALARRGARPVGLDVSPRQLEHARRAMEAAGVDFPLIEASAESVPLPDAGFDVVFCDWGAMTFGDPYLTVPEISRLLRPGGLFAFSSSSAFRVLCTNPATDRPEPTLFRDYFGMHAVEWEDEVNFQLPVGEWIRLFRTHRLTIEDLIEMRPPSEAPSTYVDATETAWARRWPMEQIWRLRKEG